MCGIIAHFTPGPGVPPAAPVAAALADMERRGPDGEGVWHEAGIRMGHRRLAIIDLDARAAQPLTSPCGRYVIVLNGEIYNYQHLRAQLSQRGVVFATTSDTEVLAALYAKEGPAMLPRLEGMFAFVIWDKQRRQGFAARDPFGIKPLYIAEYAGGVLVASQVKALMATGLVARAADPRGQAGFWMLGSVPEPRSWYRDISILPAGGCATFADGAVSSRRRWADIGEAWRQAGPRAQVPPDETARRVSAALRASVARHLVADVPVGLFLSGGIDSSAIAGMMVDAGARDITGVTVAFGEFAGSADDEAPMAAEVARHYGIRHVIRKVGRDEFVADLPRIFAAMDQPSFDGINSWYAAKAAAEAGLKVVLSGVGGDELFFGYPSFTQLPRLVRARRAVGGIPGMPAMGTALGAVWARRSGNARWHHAADWLKSIGGAWWLRRSIFAPDELPPEFAVAIAGPGEGFSPDAWLGELVGALPADPQLALAQIETMTYLRNQLLRDSDWASMDHSIELRTPLVDARLLADLAPLMASFGQFPGKRLLAMAPSRPVPAAVAHRRKTGFSIPVRQWLAEAGLVPASARFDRPWARHIAAAYGDGLGLTGQA